MLPFAAFMGCGVGVSLLIPNSLITDAADFTEMETGLKLEGTIYGFVVMINKVDIQS
jgi:Na+/melibiose symporter-like transporter